jgi:lipoprotein
MINMKNAHGFAALCLAGLMALGLCACSSKNDLAAEGDGTYYSSAQQVVESSSSEVVSGNFWESQTDDKTPKMFKLQNDTDKDFSSIEVRPSGYDNWLKNDISLYASQYTAYSFSQTDAATYSIWDFRLTTTEGEFVTLNSVDINADSGIQILIVNGGYSYNLLKDAVSSEPVSSEE